MESKEREITLEVAETAVLLPVRTHAIGRAYLHIYYYKGNIYFHCSYFETGALRAIDLMHYAILMKDGAAVVGAALYVMTEGATCIKPTGNPNVDKFLNPESLQLAINSAFEPSELSFAKMAKRHEERLANDAARAEKRGGRGVIRNPHGRKGRGKLKSQD